MAADSWTPTNPLHLEEKNEVGTVLHLYTESLKQMMQHSLCDEAKNERAKNHEITDFRGRMQVWETQATRNAWKWEGASIWKIYTDLMLHLKF